LYSKRNENKRMLRSYNSNGAHLSENVPLKSIVNAITLSSLDTLNDIDDDDDDDLDDSINNLNSSDESLEYIGGHNQIPSAKNMRYHKQQHQYQNQHNNNNNKDLHLEDSEFTNIDNNLYDYNNNFPTNYPPQQQQQQQQQQLKHSLNSHQYQYPIHSSPNGDQQHVPIQDPAVPLVDGSKVIGEDWSYSWNSNVLTNNDHRLIGEIIRKLKPYITKCVKKEVHNYFAKNMKKENRFLNETDKDTASLTKI
jgi:hypothetical protein